MDAVHPRQSRPRFRPLGADAGSLPMAMLLALVAASLSALLLPVGIGQMVTTRSASARAHALHAAQAGLDVMLGRIRAATDGSGTGVTASLPSSDLTGSVSPDGTEGYRVSVTYYAADGTTVVNVAIASPPQPSTAVLVSTGVEAAGVDPRPGLAGTRTLQATYRFRTSNENIPGGMIPINGSADGATTLCLSAASATPAVGSKLSALLCTQGDPDARRFAYTKDLTIQMFGSQTAARPTGLCLQGAGDPTVAGYAHATGQAIVLAVCAATATPHSKSLIAQQWSLRSYGTFYGTTDGVSVDNFCLNVKTPGSVGSDIVLGDKSPDKYCENGTYDNRYTLLPEPDVGAGYAGASTNWFGNGNPAIARQLVSVGHEQFGRCLDVAGSWKPATYQYMIAWPCKQSPDPAQTPWSQMWIMPAIDPTTRTGTGVIKAYVTDSTRTDVYQKYLCLQSFGTSAEPFVKVCPTGTPSPDLLWTLIADTGTYADSYVVEDNAAADGTHLCLTPTGPNPLPSELYAAAGYAGPPISKVVLRSCDGTQWQKWNAPPYLTQPPPIADFVEH